MPPFRYEAFVNPYIGSISELMGKGDQAKAEALLRIGEIQARAAEQRGQAWGNAIQGLGKIASEIPGQLQEQKDREFQTQQRERVVTGQAREDRARELSQTVSSTPDTQRMRYVNVPGQDAQLADWAQGKDEVFGTLPIRQSVPVISNAYKNLSENQIGSLNLWDISKIQQQYAQAGLGIEAQPYLKMYEDSNAGMVKHHESALATAREDASRLLQVGNYPAMMSQAKDLIPKYEANGVFSQRNLDAFKSQLASIEQMPEAERMMQLKKALAAVGGVPANNVVVPRNGRITNLTTGEDLAIGASEDVTPADLQVQGYKDYRAKGGILSFPAYQAQETSTATVEGSEETFVTRALAQAVQKNNGIPLTDAQKNTVTSGARQKYASDKSDQVARAALALQREQLADVRARGLATPQGQYGSLASDLTYGLDVADTSSFTDRFNKIGVNDKPGDAVAAARSDEHRRTMIRSAAMKSMGETKSKQITAREIAAVQLSKLRAALAELPKGTNIITGLTEEGLQKLGTSGNQKYVEVMARANTALNAYTNAISGAQFGEDEAMRYRQLFPSLRNTAANNLTLIDTMIGLSKDDEFAQWNSLAGQNTAGVNWLLNRSSGRIP
jgi:hypothetical protein